MKLEAGIPAREGPDVSRCWKNNALLLNIILGEEKARCSVRTHAGYCHRRIIKGPLNRWLIRKKKGYQTIQRVELFRRWLSFVLISILLRNLFKKTVHKKIFNAIFNLFFILWQSKFYALTMNIFLFLYVLYNIKILHLAKTWIRKIYNLD